MRKIKSYFEVEVIYQKLFRGRGHLMSRSYQYQNEDNIFFIF